MTTKLLQLHVSTARFSGTNDLPTRLDVLPSPLARGLSQLYGGI